MKEMVFVYGTLRSGLNWHHLLREASFLGEGITKDKFALYADFIPYVVKGEKICQIKGELYEVDKKTLAILDELEHHPTWYCREKTIVLVNQKEIEAWLYFSRQAKGSLIKTGDFLDYKD